MMLTEADAAARRCPLSFGPPFSEQGNMHVSAAFASGVWTATQTSPTNCIGSRCMAWRVGQAKIPAYPGDFYKKAEDGSIFYQAGTSRPERPEKGFCGQFGKPG